MAQPTPYDRITNFQNDQALAPTDPYPAEDFDAEYNAVKITTDEIIQNLSLIQRDDGELANASVGRDQLSPEITLGFGAPLPWETDVDYIESDTVFADNGFYLCVVTHTSTVFANDLLAGKWALLADFTESTADAEAAAAAAAASAAAAGLSEADAEAAALAAAGSAADVSAAQGAFRWNFDSSTTMGDPLAGKARGNGSPASAMTALAISATTADIGNPNILNWLLTWDDSTNTASRGTIYIREVNAPQNFAVFNLTGTVSNNGTWAQIGVTYVTHAGTLTNGDPISIAFARTGNQGTSGSGTGDMLAANNLSDVANINTARSNLSIGNVNDTSDVNKPVSTAQAAADALRVLKTGDTMTGYLTLHADPDTALKAATKQYVDTHTAPLDALAHSGMQINGSMEVSQELGETGTTVPGKYFCDGWAMTKAGTMVITAAKISISSYIPGFQTIAFVQASTPQASIGAGEFSMIFQLIEGYRMLRLDWGTTNAKPITIAFWSSHNPAGQYSATVRNGANNRSYATSYTQAVADVPQYNVITIPGDTTGTWAKDNTIGMYLLLAQACGSTYIVPAANVWTAGIYVAAPGQINGVAVVNSVMRFAGVVVLPGTHAPTAAQSPLIMRPYDQELATCQRYWESTYNPGVTPGTASQIGMDYFLAGAATVLSGGKGYPFKFSKRLTPSITTYSPVTGAVAKVRDFGAGADVTPIVSDIGINGFRWSANGTGPINIGAHFVADARL